MHGKQMHDGRVLLQCELSLVNMSDEVLGVDALDCNRFIFVDSFKCRVQVDTVCAVDVLHTGLLPFLNIIFTTASLSSKKNDAGHDLYYIFNSVEHNRDVFPAIVVEI